MRTLLSGMVIALAVAAVARADSHGEGTGGHDAMGPTQQHLTDGGAARSHDGMDHNAADAGSGAHDIEGPATLDYESAMDRMMQAMMVPYTGDPDVDFVRSMIPHHQGAIDMAEAVLRHGKDPEVRQLAESVIKAQTEEIAWMRSWLAKRGQ